MSSLYLTTYKTIIKLVLITAVSVPVHAQTLIFNHINVIPMDRERVLYDQRVIVVDDKIKTIEPVSSELTLEADQVIESQGNYMIPGLTDAHYHQTGDTEEENDLQYKLLIANGVTSVISMAEWSGQDTIAIRERSKQTSVLAPYYVTVGPQVNDSNVLTPDDAIKMVQLHKDRGYDFIKIHGNIPKDAYIALLDSAEKVDIRVVGHTQRDKPLEYSLRLSNIVHMEDIVMVFSSEANLTIVDIDDQLAEDIAGQVKDSGIYVAPTLSIVAMIPEFTDEERFDRLKSRGINKYLSEAVFESYTSGNNASYAREFFLSDTGLEYMAKVIAGTRQLTAAMHKQGIPMLVGSDNFGLQITGFSVHEEMIHMHNAGIPAYDVLRAATVTSARFLKRQATAGTISEGKNAEFVILSANPLEDIRNTQSIDGVMLKGQWFDRNALDEMMQQVEDAHSQ